MTIETHYSNREKQQYKTIKTHYNNREKEAIATIAAIEARDEKAEGRE